MLLRPPNDGAHVDGDAHGIDLDGFDIDDLVGDDNGERRGGGGRGRKRRAPSASGRGGKASPSASAASDGGRSGTKRASGAKAAAGTDKARLRWTPELHRLFIAAVEQLGGLEIATPKGIMHLMDTSGMTIQHIKSHLQKYRLQEVASKRTVVEGDEKMRKEMIKTIRAQQLEELTNSGAKRHSRVAAETLSPMASLDADPTPETPVTAAQLSALIHATSAGGTTGKASASEHSLDEILAHALTPASALAESLLNSGDDAAPVIPAAASEAVSAKLIEEMPHVGHALLKQLEMQKQLHAQLLAQRRLQSAIEEHGKYIASMLETQRQPR